ncbi:MAG: hypothetical protein IPK80_28770 [Nannocystis sp.]|nr:hypothetical protein [Nannocystis sp.]
MVEQANIDEAPHALCYYICQGDRQAEAHRQLARPAARHTDRVEDTERLDFTA